MFQLQFYVCSTYVLLEMMLLKHVYELGCCFALFSKDSRPEGYSLIFYWILSNLLKFINIPHLCKASKYRQWHSLPLFERNRVLKDIEGKTESRDWWKSLESPQTKPEVILHHEKWSVRSEPPKAENDTLLTAWYIFTKAYPYII